VARWRAQPRLCFGCGGGGDNRIIGLLDYWIGECWQHHPLCFLSCLAPSTPLAPTSSIVELIASVAFFNPHPKNS